MMPHSNSRVACLCVDTVFLKKMKIAMATAAATYYRAVEVTLEIYVRKAMLSE